MAHRSRPDINNCPGSTPEPFAVQSLGRLSRRSRAWGFRREPDVRRRRSGRAGRGQYGRPETPNCPTGGCGPRCRRRRGRHRDLVQSFRCVVSQEDMHLGVFESVSPRFELGVLEHRHEELGVIPPPGIGHTTRRSSSPRAQLWSWRIASTVLADELVGRPSQTRAPAPDDSVGPAGRSRIQADVETRLRLRWWQA